MFRRLYKSTKSDDHLPPEVLEEELLVEYEDRVLRGEFPDIDEYMGRYRGPEPHNFRSELQLVTALLLAGQQRRVAAN